MPDDVDPSELDRELAAHPEFGDGAALYARTLARTRVGLCVLARRRPEIAAAARAWAGAEDEQLRRLLHDPALRHAFEHDLQALRPGAPDATPLLPELLPPTPADPTPSAAVIADGPGPWPEHDRALLWARRPTAADGPAGRELDAMLSRVFYDPAVIVPVSPDADHRAQLAAGADLLYALVPATAASTLRHVGTVGLATQDAEEVSLLSISGGDGCPATLFLTPGRIADPWSAAADILHESLHLLLFETMRCGELTVPDVDVLADVGPIPWRETTWSVMRMLFALHVYTCHSLLRRAAAQADSELFERFGRPSPGSLLDFTVSHDRAEYATPADRAAWLGRLLSGRFAYMLSPQGRRFVDWLLEALHRLHPELAPAADAGGHDAPDVETTAPPPLPDADAALTAVEPADVLPLPEQERLLAAAGDSPRLQWLNLSSWTVYALCDGRSRADLETSYRREVAELCDAATADRDCRAGLRLLLDSGLVEAV